MTRIGTPVAALARRAAAAAVTVVMLATGPATASATANSSSDAVKAEIVGLIDRQGEPPHGLLPYVHSFVVSVNWADLQPTAFGPITPDNAIDQAIARVREPDYAAVGVTLKLRVLAGIDAPDWVKNIDGAPIPYTETGDTGSTTTTGTIGPFWTADFGAAYDDLQTKLAALYDSVPEIREVTVSRCSTLYDEAFARQFGDPNNVNALLAAGYTSAADKQCITDSIDAHQVWQHTTSDVAFAPFPDITNPGKSGDLAFPESVMTYCRSVLGTRCGVQNNSLSSSKIANKQYKQLCAAMTAIGPDIVLQTASQASIGDPKQVLNFAVKVGAESVELPAGYPTWPTSLLKNISAKLAVNAAPFDNG